MNIVIVGSECTPFIKTGGLADVLGALPKQLVKQGNKVSVFLPFYKKIRDTYETSFIKDDTVYLGVKNAFIGLHHLIKDDVNYYFIDNQEYFFTQELYGYSNDGERFTYFCHAVVKMLEIFEDTIDILHLNDWQTGLIPYLLKTTYHYGFYQSIKTVFSIHNIQYQGIFPKQMSLILNCPYSDILEFDGNINFMKTAIMTSDIINTVSETYKNEVLTEYYGYRLDHVLKLRYDDFYGIINGIDIEILNPKTDPLIYKHYDLKTVSKDKQLNKVELQHEFDLPALNVPMIGLVSRFADQKGIDIIKECIEEVIIYSDAQFIFMGSGEKNYETFFMYLADKYKSRVKCYIGFNEELARKIYAGCDIFLMPSKFEPCGLGQLMAMRYGALPLVRETGGLKDTVIPYNKYTNEGTGFSFSNYDSYDLKECLFKSIVTFKNKSVWKKLVQQAMSQDFSWDASANKYLELYNKAVKK